MKNKKLILTAFTFGLSVFLIKPLFDVFLWQVEFKDIDVDNLIFMSLFVAIFMGVLIKLKWVKTKNILEE